jgi:sugar lactone lactonase YvrE
MRQAIEQMDLRDLVGAVPKIERLVTGIGAPNQNNGEQFAEGPVFSRQGYLLYCDIPTMRIMKLKRAAELAKSGFRTSRRGF